MTISILQDKARENSNRMAIVESKGTKEQIKEMHSLQRKEAVSMSLVLPKLCTGNVIGAANSFRAGVDASVKQQEIVDKLS